MRLRATNDDVARHLSIADASVDALDASTRRRVGDHWTRRATAEIRVASVFAVIARELFEWGADPIVLEICARAVSDEVRHAEICRVISERYLGETVPWPAPGKAPIPPHATAEPSLRPTLYVTAMCCINETIASAWLDASLRESTSAIARAAIRELIADDVHHSRLGWAHLASPHVTLATCAKIAAWLPRLLDATVLPWLDDAKKYGDGVPAHGVPSETTTRDVVIQTLEQVVLPGFDAVRVETAPAHAWLRDVVSRVEPKTGTGQP